jgi:hypothetical protein
MSEPKLTNAQRRERRREAALKGARTRAARQETAAPPTAPPEPVAPTARQLLERARSIGREADLFSHAHLARRPHRPSAWTAEHRAALDAFLDRFIRPDGTPQPVPHHTRRTPR